MNFKPSEPFLVPFLVQKQGFSETQVTNDIFPIWTYSYFCALLLLGPFAERMKYKWAISTGIFGKLATLCILLFAPRKSMLWMQMSQVTYGLGSAADTIFLSYIYTLVSPSRYHHVTSCTRATVLFSSVTSALLGQFLISNGVSLVTLFAISSVSIAIAAVFSVTLLPAVQYIHLSPIIPKKTWKEVISDYCDSPLFLYWSLWTIIALAGHQLVFSYITNLFDEVDSSRDINGYATASARLFGSIASLFPRFVFGLPSWKSRLWKGVLLSLFPGIGAIFLYLDSEATSLLNAAIYFVCYIAMIEFCFSLDSAEIALSTKDGHFAIVFTVNTIFALLLQTSVQILVGGPCLDLDPRGLYRAFAIYFIVFSVMFSIVSVIGIFRHKPRKESLKLDPVECTYLLGRS